MKLGIQLLDPGSGVNLIGMETGDEPSSGMKPGMNRIGMEIQLQG